MQLVQKIFQKFFNLSINKNINYCDDLYSIFLKKKKLTIFDIGTHKGETVKRFEKLFINKKITYHCFEPLKKNIEDAKKELSNVTNKVNLNNFGLGSKIERKLFYENIKSNTSSFNKLNLNSKWIKERSRQYKVKINKFSKNKHFLEIQTLDNYCKKNKIQSIDILKIDTQGYEYDILKGSKSTLKKGIIKFIELELIFSDVYSKKAKLYEIEKIMNFNNYQIEAISKGGNKNDLSFEVDLVYSKKSGSY